MTCFLLNLAFNEMSCCQQFAFFFLLKTEYTEKTSDNERRSKCGDAMNKVNVSWEITCPLSDTYMYPLICIIH